MGIQTLDSEPQNTLSFFCSLLKILAFCCSSGSCLFWERKAGMDDLTLKRVLQTHSVVGLAMEKHFESSL